MVTKLKELATEFKVIQKECQQYLQDVYVFLNDGERYSIDVKDKTKGEIKDQIEQLLIIKMLDLEKFQNVEELQHSQNIMYNLINQCYFLLKIKEKFNY